MIRTILMNEFERRAREYCEVKVRAVDLNRLIRLSPCDVEGERRADGHGGFENTPPCWWDIDEGAISLDEACESCQTTYPLLIQRRLLGLRIPNLAKAMYRQFRSEVTSCSDY